MARIFIDGFESGDHDMWDGESNATVVSAVTGMDGDYCLDLAAIQEYLEKNISANDEMYFAVLYRPISVTASEQILSVYNSATPLLHVSRTDTTGLLVARMGTVTVLATGSKNLSIGSTYLIEVYIKLADSGGRFVVKVDGITDIDFTGDTKTDANTQFDVVRLGFGPVAGLFTNAYFDNFIMDDADWVGDTKIQAVVPTGAGNSTGWTPSAGANWECVDETPPNDADYVSVNAIDTTDTYATENLAGTISNVKCVQVQARVKTDGAPTPTNLKLVTRSGGTDYLSGDNLVPVAEKSFSYLWENNPADAAAWEEADVNAMEVGIKSAT